MIFPTKLRVIFVLIALISTLGVANWAVMPNQTAHSQTQQLAAQLLVSEATVEVKRANTNSWVVVRAETIISAGDQIRTDETGSASIDFLFMELKLDILPDTTLRIVRFIDINGRKEIVLQVDEGFTDQVYTGEDETDIFEMRLPGMQLTVLNSTSHIRVEPDRRSALLVEQGMVRVAKLGEEVTAEEGFGVRSPIDSRLSEVIEALDFDELDARLDGCAGQTTPDGDFSFNVRIGPSILAPRIGTISANNIRRFYGQTDDEKWYRIPFGGYFGWFSAELAEVEVDSECGNMRRFTEDYLEDIEKFSLVGTTNSAIVIVNLANIRIGPGTAYRVVDTAPTGSFLVVNGRTDDNQWLQIYQGDGKLGWVFSGLVRLNVNYEELNIIEIDVLDLGDGTETDEDVPTEGDEDDSETEEEADTPTATPEE